MASSELSSTISESSLTTKDEFEGLEVTEFDPNMLQELLYEPGEEELEGGGALMQCMDAAGTNPSPTVDSDWYLDDINNDVQNLTWLDMVEEIAGECNDMGGWYGGACIEEIDEILEMGDYSLSHSAIVCDEIGYIGLWQEN